MVGKDKQLLEPDVVLPSQFFATWRRHAPTKSGEFRLLVAVLGDAIERFQKYVRTGNQGFAEAAQWIMGTAEDGVGSEGDGRGFSFEYVCDVLDLDPASVRQGLQRGTIRISHKGS